MAIDDDLVAGGTVIRMQLGPAGREWWIERPFRRLDPIRIAAMGNRLIELNDSLFGWPGFSQTWRVIEEECISPAPR